MRRKFLVFIALIGLVIMVLKPVFSQTAMDNYNKANSMLISGNLGEAERFYKAAAKQNPNFSEAYLGLGMAQKELGKYQEAYESTSMAIKLKPSYYQAYYNMGLILESLNKYEEAIDAFEKFLKEVPGAERFSDAKQRILRLKKSAK